MKSKRMFSSEVTETSEFYKLPSSSQALYLHLCMHADDDGVVDAKIVMKLMGCKTSAIDVLCACGYVAMLQVGMMCILPHWLLHNSIPSTRKIDSRYADVVRLKYPDFEIKLGKNVRQTSGTCQADVRQLSDTCQADVSIGLGIGLDIGLEVEVETTATPFSEKSDDELKCFNDYEFTIYPFYHIHKRYNPKYPLVMGNMPPVDIKSCVDNILLFQKECKKCGVDYVEFLSAKLIQSSWATKLSNAGVGGVRVLASAAHYATIDVKAKQQSSSYNGQPKISLRPKMSDETTEYYHSYCKKRYEDEGLEWKGEVYNGQ